MSLAATQDARRCERLGEAISGGPTAVRVEWEDRAWWASAVYANGETSDEEQGDTVEAALGALVKALEKLRDDMRDEIAARDTERVRAAMVDVEIDERHNIQ